MESLVRHLVALFILTLAASAHAEGGCPPGQYPQQGQGWQTCVPIPGGANGASSTQSSRPAHQPTVRWQSHWEVIAYDAAAGALGTSSGQTTKGDAVLEALTGCREKGGRKCAVQFSMQNGCVAMVVGANYLNMRIGTTKAEAVDNSMKQCASEDTRCTVLYASCSQATSY